MRLNGKIIQSVPFPGLHAKARPSPSLPTCPSSLHPEWMLTVLALDSPLALLCALGMGAGVGGAATGTSCRSQQSQPALWELTPPKSRSVVPSSGLRHKSPALKGHSSVGAKGPGLLISLLPPHLGPVPAPLAIPCSCPSFFSCSPRPHPAWSESADSFQPSIPLQACSSSLDPERCCHHIFTGEEERTAPCVGKILVDLKTLLNTRGAMRAITGIFKKAEGKSFQGQKR